MTLLVLFAIAAGAGTALSPCVLPVLPALLSAGATGGRRRPLGVVLGLATTFTITVAGFASVIDGVGLGDGTLRSLAVIALLVFGIALLAPKLADRIEAPLSRLARFGPRSTGEGFWSGIGVGAALGFVYAPCAGPVLAAVISVGAASGSSLAVALAYALGTAVVLLAFCLGGRRVLARVPPLALQRTLGVVMVLTAVAILTQVDLRFQTALAEHAPGFLVNPTGSLERSKPIEDRLAELRGKTRFDGTARASTGSKLKVLGDAPDFAGNGRWFNTAGDRPLTLKGLRGRVVLVDFWTYTCINCLRTLPHVRAWDARYRADGLTIVGVHTPEFAFEHDSGNVRDAIARSRLRYPVVQDNDYATWNAWGNQYWPAKYLIDAKGRVRYVHFGEGEYDKTEAAIRSLLAEAGAAKLGRHASVGSEDAVEAQTPETYLGVERARGWSPAPRAGTHTYPARNPALNQFAFGGTWHIGDEPAEAVRGATIDVRFAARKVYLVLSSRGERPRTLEVRVDGRLTRRVVVRRQRLYELVSLPRAGQHRLNLRFEPGLAGYAFTFG
jgi:cytochrome c biogenesis protein CcdA/thiol-disulfide isomerase/thioredoxin